MPNKSCLVCYFGCPRAGPLHHFPNPQSCHASEIERFSQWKSVLNEANQQRGDIYIYNNIVLCNRHFLASYQLPSRRLSKNAIPTLNLEQHTLEMLSADSQNEQPLSFSSFAVAEPNEQYRIESPVLLIVQPSTSQHTDYLMSTTEKININMAVETSNDTNETEAYIFKDTKLFTQHWNPVASVIENVCRICLAVDVKMYNIRDYKLMKYYQNLIGILPSLEDKLPEMLCWECAARLRNAHSFREKALRSYNLLTHRVKEDYSLSMSEIRSINRAENRLQSSLAVMYINDESVWAGAGAVATPVTSPTADVTSPAADDVKLEAGSEGEWPGSDVHTGRARDPLDTPPRRRALPTARRRRAALAPTKKGTEPSSRIGRAALDGSVFDVLDVPLERALADAARRADRPQYRAAPYRCELCYRVFTAPSARDEHALRHSDVMGAFECAVCRCRWRTRAALSKHFTESHTRDHVCKMCPFTTRHRGVARRHERFHKGVKFQCSRCPKEFMSYTAYLTHLRLNHTCRFPCARCGFAFPTHRGVDSHKLKKHKLDNNAPLAGPYCAECDVRFATDEAHDRHLQVTAAHCREDTSSGRRLLNDYHMAEKRKCRWRPARGQAAGEKDDAQQEQEPRRHLVRCEQCGKECTGYRSYAQHFRREHPGHNRTQYSGADPVMCEHCGKFFQNPYLLRAHAGVHANGAVPKTTRRAGGRQAGVPRLTYACPLCPKRFTEKTNRARHITTIHDGAERRFRCAACDKRFWERSALQSHYDHVHLKKPWPKRTRPSRPRPAPAPGLEFESAGKDASAEV